MTGTDTTTLISLFHTGEQAEEAMADLRNAGVPASRIRSGGSDNESSLDSLQTLGLPAEDMRMLSDGLQSGGTVIVVSANDTLAEQAEEIFRKHHAEQVDEREWDDGMTAAALGTVAAARLSDTENAIPVVEEELVVGKRAFQSGGVRVISRVVNQPVEEDITLREERAVVERHAVDRAASEADFGAVNGEAIEVLSHGEEAVVSKKAKVVEEIRIGKESRDRTEVVTDTIRKTEIEIEKVAADEVGKGEGKRGY